MDRPLTVIIRSDPRESHRAGEALRVALGLSGGEPDNIQIVLMNLAPTLLYGDPLEFENGEEIETHLDALGECGLIFHVEKSFFSGQGDIGETEFEVRRVSLQDISQQISRSQRVLVFK